MKAIKKMKLNIVMPMAGLGSRFNDSKYLLPKPLIKINEKPMYAWATDSLPLEHCQKLIFILLKTQYTYNLLYNDIMERYEKYNPIILTVPKLTRGQSETVLRAKKLKQLHLMKKLENKISKRNLKGNYEKFKIRY